MKVTLIEFTGKGSENEVWRAVDLLLFTKNTRLNMSPALLDDILCWSEEKKLQELEYMSRTIKSSWEFLDVTFLIEGVTRAVAQQMTRTRQASYAMQSQRVTDAREIAVTNNLPESSSNWALYQNAVESVKNCYSSLVDSGVPLEDARGILPMNTQCNLVAKYNLRALTDLVKARKSLRAQGEYNEIVVQMEQCTIDVWPWAKMFFSVDKQIAIEMLEAVAKRNGITTGKGDGWEIAKAIDLIRKD